MEQQNDKEQKYVYDNADDNKDKIEDYKKSKSYYNNISNLLNDDETTFDNDLSKKCSTKFSNDISSVNGIFREDSDIDIAFMSDKEITDYEVFILAQELADILKRDIDLINLKNASTVFKVQVIGKGEKIYCLDDKRRMYFEMYAFKDYALLNEEREIILNNVKKRGACV